MSYGTTAGQDARSSAAWERPKTSVRGRPSTSAQVERIAVEESSVEPEAFLSSGGGLGDEQTATFGGLDPMTPDRVTGTHRQPPASKLVDAFDAELMSLSSSGSEEFVGSKSGVFEYGQMPEKMLRWLAEIAQQRPTQALSISPRRGERELTLVVQNGRVAAGPLLNGRPFVDTTFCRQHRELYRRLAQLFERSQQTGAGGFVDPVQQGLLDGSELNLIPEQRWALVRLLARILSRAAQLARHQREEMQSQPIELIEGFRPIWFSTLEIALAHQQEHDDLARDFEREASLLVDLMRQWTPRAEQSWLFAKEPNGHLALEQVNDPQRFSILDADRALRDARSTCLRLRDSPELSVAIAFGAQSLRCRLEDESFVALLDLPKSLTGRFSSAIRNLM